MARLLYNNQGGNLGASGLTSGGTTITFGVAPNFATITGSDYIPLVLDGGTSSNEIVYLTAYTAAATSGTITRAAEDATLWPAVSHAANTGTWMTAPVAADGHSTAGATVAASQTTASSTYTDLATAGPAVTLITGTSVLVMLGSLQLPPTSGSTTSYMSLAVSGATTLAAADANAARNDGSWGNVSAQFVLTGLTPGSNTFTAKYRCPAGGSASFLYRHLVVIAL